MDILELTITVAKILNSLKIPYAITGGYAVSVWGRVRSTLDIDIIVEIPLTKKGDLVKALLQVSELGYVDDEMVTRAIERKGEFNFIHIESGIKVDFWVIGDDAFSRSKIKRRKAKIIQGHKIYFLSPEDLILSKLLWSKLSESELQLGDVESILRIQKKLDRRYLDKWSKIHYTAEILNKLWKKKRK